MTKLFVDELLEFLRGCAARSNFADYVFPEELTAEHIASRFGTSKIAVLRRLRALEADGIVTSKRAYVRGKPGKRLVFYMVDLLDEYQKLGAGEPDPMMPSFGHRDLIYERISKTDYLEENGDARFVGDYTLKNVSKNSVSEIHLPPISFSTGNKRNVYDRLVKIEVDGRAMPYSSDSLQFYRKSRPGKVIEGLSYTKSKNHSTILYVVPLDKPLRPGNSVTIRLTTDLPRPFTNLREFEHTGFDVKEITLWGSMKMVAPKGCVIKLLKRYKDTSYPKGIVVRESLTGIRLQDVEERMTPPKVTENSIHWILEKPVLGYQYVMPFIVVDAPYK